MANIDCIYSLVKIYNALNKNISSKFVRTRSRECAKNANEYIIGKLILKHRT